MTRRTTMELAIARTDLSGHAGSLASALAAEIRSMIARQAAKPGARLPPSRELSRQLGVARNVVTDAYATLAAEGLVEGQASAGTVILPGTFPSYKDGPGRKPVSKLSLPREISVPLVETSPGLQRPLLEPCIPDIAFLSGPAWRSCWRDALRRPQSAQYQCSAGEPALRREIAKHLAQTRGLDVDADEIVITNGALEGIHLTAMALLRNGDRVAVENPGWHLARHALHARGFDVVTIPVDCDGLLVEQLQKARRPPRLVLVTPAHQFPVGGRLPASRRRALLAWASRNDGWIIEDDYDSEFRFDVPPLPALAAMAGDDRVIHIGSFSKTLTPDLRIGYIAAQDRLADAIRRLKLLLNCKASTFEQAAIARFMAEGYFDRHLAKMRRLYGTRRSELVRTLKNVPVDGRILGVDAGLHVFWSLRRAQDTKALRYKLTAFGRQLASVEDYAENAKPWLGFVVGFSSTSFDHELSQLTTALLQPPVRQPATSPCGQLRVRDAGLTEPDSDNRKYRA